MNLNQQESSREKIINLTSRLNSHLKRMEELYEDLLPLKISDLVSIEDPEQLIRRPEEVASFLRYFKVLTEVSQDVNSEREAAQAEFEKARDEICTIADDLEANLKGYKELAHKSVNAVKLLSGENRTLKSEMEKVTSQMSTITEQVSERGKNSDIIEAGIDKSKSEIESLTEKFMKEIEIREASYRRDHQELSEKFTRELEIKTAELNSQNAEIKRELEIKIAVLEGDNVKIKVDLKNKTAELEAQKAKFTRELEAQKAKFMRELVVKTAEISKLNQKIDTRTAKFSKALDEKRLKISNLEKKVKEQNDRCISLKKEVRIQRNKNHRI